MFRFKQFSVAQDRCGMKVGTDGVLLGAWVDIPPHTERIVDVGTGTGLIALMAAQRSAARITAVEIDVQAALQACANVAASPWADRVEVVCAPVQEYRPSYRADLVVSNPPYYDDSLPSPDRERTLARHTASLSFAGLLDAAQRLTHAQGRLAVVLPAEQARRFRMLALSSWRLVRATDVRTTSTGAVRRVLMEFSRVQSLAAPRCDELVIQHAPGDYTARYRALTQDFYLKF